MHMCTADPTSRHTGFCYGVPKTRRGSKPAHVRSLINCFVCTEENMVQTFSVSDDTDTRSMLWTCRGVIIMIGIKKSDFETETEEYVAPIVSNIYGK